MKIVDSRTPVVVLHCGLGALAIMRSLGMLGVEVFGVTNSRKAHALSSRYCRGVFEFPYHAQPAERFSDFLVGLRAKFGQRPLLIATSDETAIAVADRYEQLAESYVIGQNGGSLVATLADKMTMFGLARKYDVPAPATVLPASLEEARLASREVTYPVMLKGAMGNRLQARTGRKMVVVESPEKLLEQYALLEDPESPNLMIQELIPGGDDQVYIFNGYFDASSECRAGFTGRKIRQYPVHVGCASLGECCWVPEVAELTTRFMKDIGYRGILDIGYRKDPRDGKYKVLDINPRIGQAFRLFVAENDLDVCRAMYLDLTGQPIPESPPREGRRWMIEDYDLTSTYDYFREGSLGLGEWLRSFRRLEEAAWFSLRDPVPFLKMAGRFSLQVGTAVARRLRGVFR